MVSVCSLNTISVNERCFWNEEFYESGVIFIKISRQLSEISVLTKYHTNLVSISLLNKNFQVAGFASSSHCKGGFPSNYAGLKLLTTWMDDHVTTYSVSNFRLMYNNKQKLVHNTSGLVPE